MSETNPQPTPQPNPTDAPLILGVSGLRGIVGQSLTPEVAVRYAAAFGEWLKQGSGDISPMVCIGRDGRRGGEAVYEAAVAGLLGSGCRVTKLGVAATPTIGFVCGMEHDGAIVVTASHNPAEWNGLKCLVADDFPVVGDVDLEANESARAPSASEAEEIIGIFKSGVAYPEFTSVDPLSTETDAPYRHEFQSYFWMNHVLDAASRARLHETDSLGYRCVLDAVNCAGSSIAVPFLESIGEVVGLNCSDSGIFPHTPEPTKENLSGEGGLCDAVPGLKADIGFAQDPDADRLAIVDEKGEYIGEEYTLVLCAMALLEARGENKASEASASEDKATPLTPALSPPGGEREREKKPVLVTNLSTSRMIEDVAARYGAEVQRTPVGEANVVQRMKGLAEQGRDVVLGGEGNGGVIWPQVVYVRDSLSGMALVLALMARTGKTVSELVTEIEAMSPGGNGYCIVKKKVDIASKADAEPAVSAVSGWAKGIAGARIDLQDGVRVDFDEGGWVGSWVHVRASNTEAIMRLICEAPSEAVAAEVLRAVEGAIAGG
ncbi:MAG: phosphomannomutase [Phycisphaerales bacterium]|jgi:phosphomannomutase